MAFHGLKICFKSYSVPKKAKPFWLRYGQDWPFWAHYEYLKMMPGVVSPRVS